MFFEIETMLAKYAKILVLLLLAWLPAYVSATVVDGDSIDCIVFLGDSNTSIGGDACNIGKAWTKWFVADFPVKTYRSYARSGATWTNAAGTQRDTEEYTEKLGDNNVVYNQCERLLEACAKGEQAVPNLIVIAAGTNDAWFRKARPSLFSESVDAAFAIPAEQLLSKQPAEVLSLAGSVRFVCERLRKAFPEARIVLLTPMQTTATSLQNIRRVSDTIAACAQRLEIDVVWQDGTDFLSREQERKHVYTSDGTHTNPRGAKKNGRLLARRIKELLKP